MSSYIEELDKKHCNDTDKKIIVRINGNYHTCEKDLNRIADLIVIEYGSTHSKNGICIGEFINNVCVPNISLEDAAIIYAKVYSQTAEGNVIRHSDNYDIKLWLDEQ